MGLEFFLVKPAPLPNEIRDPLTFIQKVGKLTAQSFWQGQLSRVKQIVTEAGGTQELWEAAIPTIGNARPPSLRTVALLHLMKSFDLGGDKWIKQFVFGFPIVGEIEQTGVSPMDDSQRPPPEVTGIWNGNSQRFQTRAKNSGTLNAQMLWGEAMTQVDKGWLGVPAPLDLMGRTRLHDEPDPVVAFRFGVDLIDKIRSCDDLKYSTTNEYCTVWAPIKLPTWGHIGQMTLDVKETNRPWSFSKVGHEAAYKQLPLGPTHAKYATVALRRPTLGAWRAFRPHTLLFGAEAAVTHYNCFSRTLAVLINRIFGIPLMSYFDDLGALTPSEITQLALETIKEFLLILMIFLNGRKTNLGEDLVFLGLLGFPPNPSRRMTLAIVLPQDKKDRWVAAIKTSLTKALSPKTRLTR